MYALAENKVHLLIKRFPTFQHEKGCLAVSRLIQVNAQSKDPHQVRMATMRSKAQSPSDEYVFRDRFPE